MEVCRAASMIPRTIDADVLMGAGRVARKGAIARRRVLADRCGLSRRQVFARRFATSRAIDTRTPQWLESAGIGTVSLPKVDGGADPYAEQAVS